MRCELITDFSRLEELSADWQRWERESAHTSVFQSWEWARAYWQAYGTGLFLCTLAVHAEDRVLGILPLARRGETIEFLGSLESDYNDLLCEPGWAAPVLGAALDCLMRSPFEWSSGVLDNILAHSLIARSIPILPLRIRRHLQLAFRCPCPAIVFGDNREQTLRALINKEQLKRYHKKLQRLGALTFHHIEGREEAQKHLNRFFYQHITRWAMSGLRSQFLSPERRAFYEHLVDELDLARQLRFSVLELNSQPIAYHIGFESNGKLLYYKPAFDVNYWDFCPGDVLLRNLLQYAGGAGLRELDLTVGDERYKYRYANHIESNYALYVDRFPARFKSRLTRAVRHARQTIRQKPRLKSILRAWARRLEASAAFLKRLGRRDALQRGINGMRSAYRTFVWRSEEALFFCHDAESISGRTAIELLPARLDTLARLALQYPDEFNESTLRKYRDRLKQGHKSFIATVGTEVCVLWLESCTELSIPEFGLDCKIPLQSPSIFLRKSWASPEFPVQEALPHAFRALATECGGAALWVHCSHDQHAMRCIIEEAGFRLRYRLQFRALLQRFPRRRLQSFDEAEAPSTEASPRGYPPARGRIRNQQLRQP